MPERERDRRRSRDRSRNRDSRSLSNLSHSSRDDSLEPENMRKMFIGGLSYKTTDDSLRNFYEHWGDLTDCIVMKDRDNKSRGFGFITFLKSSMVDATMGDRPHEIDGRQVMPKRAVPREEANNAQSHMQVKKVFVGGLKDQDITEDDLEDYFGKYGRVKEAIIMEKDGKPRGFAFVSFDDYDPVDKLILEKHHRINDVNVTVKKAFPKNREEEDDNRGRGGDRMGGGRGGRDFGGKFDRDRGFRDRGGRGRGRSGPYNNSGRDNRDGGRGRDRRR